MLSLYGECTMNVLILSWELVPFYVGGLGIVCTELTRSLKNCGVGITYMLPLGKSNLKPSYVDELLVVEDMVYSDSACSPKNSSTESKNLAAINNAISNIEKVAYPTCYSSYLYGDNLLDRVYRYASQASSMAVNTKFDIIHAHDWTSFPAAIALKKAYGKPLVVHVHITEYDKSGGGYVNPQIYHIEREGMLAADRVIVVSEFLKKTCITRYHIPAEKISVVYNSPVPMNCRKDIQRRKRKKGKIVMFAGRVTLQKGPDYFVETAKLILDKRSDVQFILAGNGDMLPRLIDRTAELGIIHTFIFTGSYNREQADTLFSIPDVFIMPSVSEPFGLVAYEALINKIPVIVSKQSGIAEVLEHCFKVDFWNIKDIANKTLALLQYPALHEEMAEEGYREALRTTWEDPARHCIQLYREVLHKSIHAA